MYTPYQSTTGYCLQLFYQFLGDNDTMLSVAIIRENLDKHYLRNVTGHKASHSTFSLLLYHRTCMYWVIICLNSLPTRQYFVDENMPFAKKIDGIVHVRTSIPPQIIVNLFNSEHFLTVHSWNSGLGKLKVSLMFPL